jgi:tetratricopeptide (TPR) repeat protein
MEMIESDEELPAIDAIRGFINGTIRFHAKYAKKRNRKFTKEFLSEIYERLVKFHKHLSREDGSLNKELFQEVEEDADDLEGFLLERIFEFARYGLVDEAVNIGRWFSAVSCQPENFLRDVGCVLAEAGRREEALKQIEENFRRFPDDVWVIINAGDARRSLGDVKEAEEYFLRAREAATELYDRLGALERLIDLSASVGDASKAEEYEKEYRLIRQPDEPGPEKASLPGPLGGTIAKGRKIGRNEPCPCGSGKKYKTCCGR